MKQLFLLLFVLAFVDLSAQNKKPLDQTVYDDWQSIGEKKISNNGKYVVYAINPQEGDGELVIQEASGKEMARISRGYNATITEDDAFVVYKIKPWYKATREAKIKKKKPDEQPKDSLGVFNLNTGAMKVYPRIKSYKTPEKGSGWLVMLAESNEPKKDTARDKKADFLLADGLDADDDKPVDGKKDEGGDLVIINLPSGKEKTIKHVTEYELDKPGKHVVFETGVAKKDSTAKPAVHLYDLGSGHTKVIMGKMNEAKSYSFDDDGGQLAFVSERDSSAKALQKFYKLWYYKTGYDSAIMIADRFTKGVYNNWTVSENSDITFSKSGKRLMFGTAPVLPPKDTSVPEIDRVSVDIWNYQDDYLQPQQLKTRDREEKRSYLAMYDWENQSVVQLANKTISVVYPTLEGDGKYFYGSSDSGLRVSAQWQGFTLKSLYVVNPETGAIKLIKSNTKGQTAASYTGKYLLWYDEPGKQYFVYDADKKSSFNISKGIPYPVYDEENDVPDDPNPYGAAKWVKDDASILIHDKYDVWQVDPQNPLKPVNVTKGLGRKNKVEYKVLRLDDDEKFYETDQTIFLSVFNTATKGSGIAKATLGSTKSPELIVYDDAKISGIVKSKNNEMMAFTKETFTESPDLYTVPIQGMATASANSNFGKYMAHVTRLSRINPQQQNYAWGTAELFKWTAYTGKQTEGILYKPANFDPKKKYPMIVYFYERNNETLNNYIAPAPTPSRLNPTFFASNGYVVFIPDIWYTTGHPGKSAYNYILSGTRAVVKQGFVDSTKVGLQGQSWGGYQIADLITRTPFYAAAWAGAPVANMTSAYGGIRWGSGMNRQFQYEKTQSRIGATLWQRPDLYIENSPLFHLPKVKTPLVIMANDNDDAVPWYQGIEMFTGLRRLGKEVWLLNYNNDFHNLVERRNRKDISIREQQFFDWKLKGEKPPVWLAEGVPAVMKGRTLGLETAE